MQCFFIPAIKYATIVGKTLSPSLSKKSALSCLLIVLFSLFSTESKAQVNPGFKANGKPMRLGDTLLICIGSSVTYEQTASNFSTLSWRFKLGSPATSTSGNVTVTYNVVGFDSTIQTVVSGVDTANHFIFVKVSDQKPVADFSFNPNDSCGNIPVLFNSSGSVGNTIITKYKWTFGDGDTSILANPSHQFLNATGTSGTQNYSVMLTITNNLNCSHSISKTVTVKKIPDASLGNGDPANISLITYQGVPTFRRCVNSVSFPFKFTNASNTISINQSYTIKWGDGSPDSTFNSWPAGNVITHVYGLGQHDMIVTINGSTGCIGIKKYNVFLGSTPAGGFASPGNTSICAFEDLKFIISGFQNNPPGTSYTILTSDGKPSISFQHPPPDTVVHNFETGSCGYSASNGFTTYSNAFGATLIVQNPCDATSVNVIPIYVSGKPRADFSFLPASNVCTGSNVTFNDNSLGGGVVTSLGGGNSSCSYGKKTVWTVTPSTGFTTGSNFGSLNGSPGNPINWTGGASSPIVNFNAPGTYSVKMYAANDRCGVDSISKTICVRVPPQASFSMNKKTSCGVDTAIITNTSPLGGCLGDAYSWTVTYTDPISCGSGATGAFAFVGGTSSTSKDPRIRFANPGRYVITLTITATGTAGSCPSPVVRDTFWVKSKPKISINPISTVCVGNSISPTAVFSNCYANDTTFLWTFNNGTPTSANTLVPGSVLFGAVATYPITLDVTNECGVSTATANAAIIATPTSNAGPDRSVCSGVATQIGSAATTGLTYQWSPTTGLSSGTAANPNLTLTYTGPFDDTTVMYIVTTSAGVNCTSKDTVNVTIKKKPVVVATPATAQACAGTPVQFIATGAATYAWSPATGLNVVNSDTVLATPNTTTTYTVVGTATNGCTANANATVTVIPYVNVNAGLDTIVCNTSSAVLLFGSPAGGTWSGNNFIISSGVFNAAAAGNGTYPAIYTAGTGSCTRSDTLMITVIDIPIANAGNDTTVCQQTGTFQLAGLPAGGRWTGSAFVNINGAFTPSTAGTYTLIYSIGGGTCIGRDTMIVTVVGGITNNTISADQSICTGQQPASINGSLASGGNGSATYQWQSSVDNINWVNIASANGQNYQPPVLTDTMWYRRIATTNLCSGPQANTSSAVRIIVHENATATFNPSPVIGCVPFSITPTVINLTPDNVNVIEYRWYVNGNYIGSGQSFPTQVMNVPGDSITVKLLSVSRFGCKNDSTERGFKTIVRPVPSFTKNDSIGCGPLQITFANTTPNASQYNFQWNFGQGQTSTLTQPGTITFPVNPIGGDTTYTVTMKVLSACDTIPVTTSIVVRGKPRVLFSPNRTVGCSPMPVTFANTSKGSSATYTWDFGDGTTPLATNNPTVNHTFTTGVRDTFYVKLVGMNDCGADSAIYNIIVNPNSIQANVAINGNERYGCAPHTVHFINNTSGANTFTWNFGDGSGTIVTTKGIDTITHTYTTAGTFTTTLLASNSCNDTTDTEVVTVALKPTINFTASPLVACVTDTIRFTNLSDTAISNLWKFGDNTTSSSRNPVKTYTAPGTYRVWLFGNKAFPQGFGCMDSNYVDIQIRDTISGSLTVSDSVGLCLPFTVTFKNDNRPSQFTNWNFGDGTTATGDSVVHTYTTQGIFTATMISKGTGGCIYKSVQNITVTSPSGSLLYANGYICPGNSLRMEVKNGNATQYRYMFGDGDSLTTTNTVVFHQYLQPGTYVPFVYLLRGSCKIKISAPDTVKVDAIKAGLRLQQTQVCGATTVNFTDTSRAFFGLQSWQWNFGDGTTSSLQNPTKIFNASGTYFVRLIITGKSGCIDTVTVPVNIAVHNFPTAAIGGDSLACTGQPLPLQALVVSQDSIVNLSWTFGNNTTASGINVTALYNASGTYVIRLIVTTLYGCADTVYKTIVVRATPLVNAGPDVRICKGNSVQLNAFGATTWSWSPIQFLSCTNCANPIANPPVSTQYVVSGTNAAGCTARDTIVVEVIQPFVLTVSPNDSICIGQSTQLFATGASKYLWNPVSGLSSGTIANPIANPTTTTRYQVIGSDAFNCFADTGYVTVGVGDYPTVDIGTGGLVVAGTQVPFTPVLTNGPFKNYAWTPSVDLSCFNCPNPVATINQNITYKLEVTNIYGCKGSDTIQYTVRCEEATQVFIPTGFSPDNDGINDVFMVRGKGLAMVKYFRVFNRWGQLVFERENVKANDVKGGWDGRINGVPADPDVYVFTAEVICTAGGTFVKKGNVTLVR